MAQCEEESLNNIVFKGFQRGDIMVKIIEIDEESKTYQKGMVISNTDYEAKIKAHVYSALLFVSDFKMRLAYLFGCLNYGKDFSHPRGFLFLYRKKGDTIWYTYFKIPPYANSIY